MSTITPTSLPSQLEQSPPPVPREGRSAGTKRDLTATCRWSSALVAVAAVTAGIGAFHPDVFRDPAWTTGNAQGTELVILLVALPTVVISMMLAARGSLRARITWLGALSYILYNSAFFAYGIHFNSLFLLYAATLSLAVWSIVALLRATAVRSLRAHVAPHAPVRVLASYLAVSTALFALVWLKDVVPAILGNRAPAGLTDTGMITNPVQMTDFAFAFPLTVLAAVWLWQRRAWGYVLAGMYLVYGVIEAISVATDQTFGHLRDGSHSIAVVPAFAVLALIELVPAVVFLRSLRRGPISFEREDPASTS
jgi:hypothetical protein